MKNLKLTDNATTTRLYAGCCNSAMMMKFDGPLHWVPVYRARLQGDVPPVQFRICTKFKPADTKVPTDVPSSLTYPFGFLAKLMKAKIAMLLRPHTP